MCSSDLVVTVGVHLGGLVADGYVHFGWREILIPNASQWKPGPVTLGVIALWLFAIVQLTSMLRRRLPRRAWKTIHLFSYACWFMVSIHAGLAGTDVTNRVYQAVALVTTIAAVAATILRIATPQRARGQRTGPTTEPT